MPNIHTEFDLEKQVLQLKKELRESEHRYKALFEKAPVAVAYHRMIYDDKGSPVDYFFLDVNQAFIDMTGVNPVGKRVTQAFPGIEEDPFNWIGKYEEVVKTGKELRFQQYFPLNDRWYDIVAYRYQPDHFAATFLEITERKKAKLALESSQRRFKALIKNSSDSIVILNETGLQTYVSDAVEKHLGFKPEEVTNIPVIDEMIHPEDKDKTLAAFQQILEKGQASVQYRHKHKNGSWVHLEAWGTNQMENPDIQGVVVNVRNISEWKRAEQALKKSERRFRLITENITDVIWTMDMNFIYTYATPSIFQQCGFTAGEIVGLPYIRLVANQYIEKVLSILKQKLDLIQKDDPNGWDPADYEIAQECKTGPNIWTRNTVSFIPGPDRQPVWILGTSMDITDRKKAETEKLKAQKTALENEKYALVGQIAGKMAHDFNNVLGSVMGNAELALLSCPDDETRKTLSLILKQTRRGKNLTKNLVAFAKDQELKQEIFPVNDKIDLVLNLLKKDLQGITVRTDLDGDNPDLLADPGMIEHSLVNLIQNSIHATSQSKNPEIKLQTFRKDNLIQIVISDNGCGIPAKYLKKIYTPAFTLKGNRDVQGVYASGIKGSGYGMANVKKYMEQHNGKLSINSTEGKGTSVTIGLPENNKTFDKSNPVHIEDQAVCMGKRILLVEDEESISDVQHSVLTREPNCHMVDIAIDASTAMELIDQKEYDLVSLDYVLPGELNGMDAYEYIRKSDPTIPILFISGNLEFLESIKELKHQDSRIDHISKPCRNKDYINRINNLFIEE